MRLQSSGSWPAVLLAAAVAAMAIGPSGPAPGGSDPQPKQGDLHILAIGIDRGAGAPLAAAPSAASDAQRLASALARGGRPLHERVFTQMLLGEAATRQGLVSAFHEVIQSSTEDDTFVFFFARRATPAAVTGGDELVLIPSDAAEPISGTALRSLLRQVQARNKLIAIDSFYGALFPEEEPAAGLEGGPALAAATGANVVLVGTDAAAPRGSERHGALTSALLAALGGDTDHGRDGSVTARELADAVSGGGRRELSGEVVGRASTLGADFTIAETQTRSRASPGCSLRTCAPPHPSPGLVADIAPPRVDFAYGTLTAETGELLAPVGSFSVEGQVKGRSPVVRLSVNGADQDIAPDGSFRATVQIDPGSSLVEVIAVDAAGNASRDALTIRAEREPDSRRGARPIDTDGSRTGVVPGSRRRDSALVFATDEYLEWSKLSNPVFDGTTIARRLGDHYGFETEVVREPDVTTLVKTLLRYQKKDYGPRDQLLVFFAGHGFYSDPWLDGFLVGRTSPRLIDASTFGRFLPHGILFRLVDRIPCSHILLVLDACFGGQALDLPAPVASLERPGLEWASGLGSPLRGLGPLLLIAPGLPLAQSARDFGAYQPISEDEFLSRKLRGRTRRLLTSGGKEYVPDGRPGHHSPFARALIEALDSRGAADRFLTMDEVYSFLEKVDPEPRRGRFTADSDGDFVLVSSQPPTARR